MDGGEAFFDSNVLLYLLSGDDAKADAAEALVGRGGAISVQVLNEFAAISLRKLKFSHQEVREVLVTLRAVCAVHPLTEATHDLGLYLAERYRLSFYDALIAAAALGAGCKTLYSEDMQHGQVIEGTLGIHNPFVCP